MDKFFSVNILFFWIFFMVDKEIVIVIILCEGVGFEDRWILLNLIGYLLIWLFFDDCDRFVDDDIWGFGLVRGIWEFKIWWLLMINSGRKM